MADSTIATSKVVLFDNWPGAVRQYNAPSGGFASSDHHNISKPQFDAGYKVQVDNRNGKGPSTLVYLQVGTQNAATALRPGSVVVPDSTNDWYRITNDPDDCIQNTTGVAVIAISAMTNGYWGWFWCEGPQPDEVPAIGSTLATDGSVIPGLFSAGDLAADEIGLSGVQGDGMSLGRSMAFDA